MKILYIGGTGQISFDCVHESVKAGHEVFVFNRGNHNQGLPEQTNFILGDMTDDDAYGALAGQHFDVVCQFRVFDADAMRRDMEIFTGYCGRYVFISSASAYEKPMTRHVITEATPLSNPFWEYSRNKAECEALLRGQDEMEYVIVRPSHTARTKFTTAFGDGDHWAMRMLAGKPVIAPGDGTSLWTITRSEDFAPPFVKLITADAAAGEAFHLTSDNAYMWNAIYQSIGRALDVNDVEIVHVPTDTLVTYDEKWRGQLLGDKAYSVVFDNSKAKSVVGDFKCETTLDEFCQRSAEHFRDRQDAVSVDSEADALIDAIIEKQRGIAAG